MEHVPADPVRVIRKSRDVRQLANPSRAPGHRDFDIWTIFEILLRYWQRITVVTILLTGLATVIIYRLQPLYSADAVVLASNGEPSVLTSDNARGANDYNSDALQTEVQILTSRVISEQTVAKLELSKNPEFNSVLQPVNKWALSTLIDRFKAKLSAPPAGVNMVVSPDVNANKPTQESELANVLRVFQSRLKVATVGKSQAIRITFVSADPVTAAAGANTVAEIYQQRQIDAKRQAYDNSVGWVSKHLEEAQNRLAETQAKLVEARKAVLAKDGASIEEVLRSPLIQSLRQHQAVLKQTLASLKDKFGPAHPDVISTQAELESIDTSIQSEIKKITDQMVYDVGREQLDVLQTSRRLTELQTGTKGDDSLGVMERQAAVEDSLYRDLLKRSKTMEVQGNIPSATSEIISRADVPIAPVFPKKKILIALSFCFSALLTAILTFVFERRNRFIVSMEQAENWLDAEGLGMIPAVSNMRSITDVGQIFSKRKSHALYSESLRSVHVKLQLSRRHPPRSIMFTSAVPGEGKSSTAVAMAHLVASTGRKTVIVDCDLRRPSVHAAFGMDLKPGLCEHLSAGSALSDVVRCHQQSGVAVITAGDEHSHPADLLRSQGMADLLETLSKSYDTVIIDSPPVHAVPDALVLASEVDAVAMVVRWRKTLAPVAQRALHSLAGTGAHVGGVVLSRVDVKRMIRQKLDDYYDYGALKYAGNTAKNIQA